MKRAIVTGANGFVGSAVVKERSGHGVQVWAVVRNEASNITSIEDFPNVHIVCCELSEIEQLPQKISERGFDVFYHFAWEGVSGAARANAELQTKNIYTTVNAVDTCARLQCKRFVGIGTLAQYDCLAYAPEDGSQPLQTVCYASAKIAAHYMSKARCVSLEIEHIWTYLSNLYGLGDRSENFINYAVECIRNSAHPAFTNGEQLYDFVDISDTSRALLAIGERGHSLKSYYVGSGEARPLKEYIEILHQKIAPEKEIFLGEIPFHGRCLDGKVFDCSKLFLDTGFRAVVPFEVGIDRMLAGNRG